MTVSNDALAIILATVRKVPEHDSDSAWAYIASRYRMHGDEPSSAAVLALCGDTVRMFAADCWHRVPIFKHQKRRSVHAAAPTARVASWSGHQEPARQPYYCTDIKD
jgi:hypothetical protein